MRQPSHKPDRADKIEIEATKTLPKWFRHLSAGVSNAFDFQVIHHPLTGTMSFIGVGADAHVASYTFTYLFRTLRQSGKYSQRCRAGGIGAQGTVARYIQNDGMNGQTPNFLVRDVDISQGHRYFFVKGSSFRRHRQMDNNHGK